MDAQQIYNAAKHGWSQVDWTSGLYYRDKDGHSCDAQNAKCACLIGAIAYGAGVKITTVYSDLIGIEHDLGISNLPGWLITINDRASSKDEALTKCADALGIPTDMR